MMSGYWIQCTHWQHWVGGNTSYRVAALPLALFPPSFLLSLFLRLSIADIHIKYFLNSRGFARSWWLLLVCVCVCVCSVIRPSTAHPRARGVRRSDPVARYQQYREFWEQIKPPGERPRNALRWHIKVRGHVTWDITGCGMGYYRVWHVHLG